MTRRPWCLPTSTRCSIRRETSTRRKRCSLLRCFGPHAIDPPTNVGDGKKAMKIGDRVATIKERCRAVLLRRRHRGHRHGASGRRAWWSSKSRPMSRGNAVARVRDTEGNVIVEEATGERLGRADRRSPARSPGEPVSRPATVAVPTTVKPACSIPAARAMYRRSWSSRRSVTVAATAIRHSPWRPMVATPGRRRVGRCAGADIGGRVKAYRS